MTSAITSIKNMIRSMQQDDYDSFEIEQEIIFVLKRLGYFLKHKELVQIHQELYPDQTVDNNWCDQLKSTILTSDIYKKVRHESNMQRLEAFTESETDNSSEQQQLSSSDPMEKNI